MMEVAIIGPHSAKWMREKVLDNYIDGQTKVRQEMMKDFFKLEDVYAIIKNNGTNAIFNNSSVMVLIGQNQAIKLY
jgi:hypothetical protein